MIKLEPINDYLILRKLESSSSMGDIYIPEEDKQQIIKAEVIAVGPGKVLDSGQRAPMQCVIGDLVLVNTLACAPCTLPIDLEGEFLLIPERDLAAIVRE